MRYKEPLPKSGQVIYKRNIYIEKAKKWQRLEKEINVNIEMNKFYTTADVLNIFGISERTYYRRQLEFNEYLELYFNYRA